MQNLVNLLYREEEREMLPLCAAEGDVPASVETFLAALPALSR
jgi:aryl-alcohol dehydrogenase-like predicted oxidoreductase